MKEYRIVYEQSVDIKANSEEEAREIFSNMESDTETAIAEYRGIVDVDELTQYKGV